MTDYLNQLSVQRAIGAVPPTATQPLPWVECSTILQYDFDSVATSVVPVLRQLMATPGFHALVYSGDVDGIVPVSGTLNWIATLGQRVVKPWRVWLDMNGQAGGFVTVYENFTFTTVRGAVQEGMRGCVCPPHGGTQALGTWVREMGWARSALLTSVAAVPQYQPARAFQMLNSWLSTHTVQSAPVPRELK